MARFGVRITLAKCLELPVYDYFKQVMKSRIRCRIRSKCLISYLFLKEVCLIHIMDSNRIILEWYPINWPTYNIQLKDQNLLYTYKNCSVIKIDGHIDIIVNKGSILIRSDGLPALAEGDLRVANAFLPYANEIISAAYELPYLAFRIYEKIKDKI